MCLYPIYLKGQFLACKNCIECQIQHSNEWAFRIALESSLYKNNCLITLTYNNENLPSDGNLSKRDLQLFFKRLRKRLYPVKIRYFACGEYGERGQRPHYHIILFNYDFPDKVELFKDKKDNQLYISDELSKLWTFGFHSIGNVTIDSAKYCAKYLQKDYKNKIKSFLIMSKGLGYEAFKPEWLKTDKIYINGKYIKIPRYFLDKVQKMGFENDVEELKQARLDRSFKDFKSDYSEISINEYTGELRENSSKNVFFSPLYREFLAKKRQKFRDIFGKDFYRSKKVINN